MLDESEDVNVDTFGVLDCSSAELVFVTVESLSCSDSFKDLLESVDELVDDEM